MAKLDENSACVGRAGFHHDFFRWRYLLASLASVVLGIGQARLAWAQDGIECQPGTHCAPHPIGKPCIRCIPDAPPTTIIFVDWRNSGSQDGTAAHPFRTLPQALTAAPPGYTIAIRTGFYSFQEARLIPWPLVDERCCWRRNASHHRTWHGGGD